jgi:gliding motility-associated-like protein
VRVENELGCERFDTVSVKVKEKPILDLGPDRTICAGDTLRLMVPEVSAIRWSGSSGITCTNCNNPVLRPLGNNSLYIVNALKNGCPGKDSIRIKILSSDIIPGLNDTTVCSGSPVQLKSLYNNVRWSPTVNLSDPGIPNPVVKPTTSTTYFASLTEDLCTVKETYKIGVVNKTEISGRNMTVCPKDDILLKPEGVASTFLWTGPNIIGSTTSATAYIVANQSAEYRVIASNQTCAADTAIFNVTVIDFIRLADSIEWRVLPDVPFQLNKSLANLKKYSFGWIPDTLLTCVDCPSPFFQGNSNQRYTFNVMDPATSCQLEQVVNVFVSTSCNPKDFYAVPNVFTPNRDGINDVLLVIPKSADQIKSFKIFNRFGVQMFNTFDISVGWDGTFKGKIAPVGVYIYMVEGWCPGTNKSVYLTGDVTLLR